jgi:Ca2+-binding EF-hand superfamily protein
MRFLNRHIPLLLAATVLASLPALADNQDKMMNHMPADMQTHATMPSMTFSSYDMNGDVMVTNSELDKMFLGKVSPEVFSSFDSDKNGTFNEKEFTLFMDRNRDTAISNYQTAFEIERMNKINQEQAEAVNADVIKQNEIAEKFNNRPGKVFLTLDFKIYDRNGDGFVDVNEFKSRTEAIKPENVYGTYDHDKDLKLNIDEFHRFVNSDPVIPVDVEKKLGYKG